MTMMTATFSSFEAIGSKHRSRSVWRQFLGSLIEAPTPHRGGRDHPIPGGHRHDLPAQVFIALERRHFGP